MKYDAVIIGSGPNGLAAAITLADAGFSVHLVERNQTAGGGTRSAELTDPGFIHDVCSTVHPLAFSSPFFRKFSLDKKGVEWIMPPAVVSHPLENEPPVMQYTDLDKTREFLGEDAVNYSKIMKPLIRKWKHILPDILGPLKIPAHPVSFLSFGMLAVQSAYGFTFRNFRQHRAKALFSGMAAHSMLSLDQKFSAAVGLVLMLLGHTAGWPIPRGGSQKITNALLALFKSLGGEVETGKMVRTLKDIPDSRIVLFDTSPREMSRIAGERFHQSYRNQLERFRYGPGIFKIDWALREPIPFRSAQCSDSATVHVGGTLDEIAEAEEMVWQGRHPGRPFVILAQQTLFDPTRAPEGQHTAWAYCHVPSGSTVDMTRRIEDQIERFAPSFRDIIVQRHTMNSVDMETYNPNYIGGDINGGLLNWKQLFFRPAIRFNPYTTPDPGLFICSSSTPPGGGVHGMCGYQAAQTVLRRVFGRSKESN
ncbi:MAG: NAD(P)/FAD-dependent oxidoreductase [Calditrichaeota bacterium]|nr:NAD(P)/FAD-dependent oxidoreductase [Calditrichota bacterium]RQW01762.1 MAG: NAD(P)/FAD-dependent oxidoreductase [Calditrichota bacterium]